MPPQSKRNKIIVTSKENDIVSTESKSKNVTRNTKPLRKALSDKTNSASDDDPLTSSKLCIRTRRTVNTGKNVSGELGNKNTVLSRRNKTLAKNDFDNQERKNHKKIDGPLVRVKRGASQKRLVVVISPLKIVETRLADSRPKRICRLPLKFEGHSISPSKYIPIQPIQASTPVIKNNVNNNKKILSSKESVQVGKNLRTLRTKVRLPENSQEIKDNSISSLLQKSKNSNVRSTKPLKKQKIIQKTQKGKKETSSNKRQADSNNNGNDLKENKACNILSSYNEKPKIVTLIKELSRDTDKNGRLLKRDGSSRDVYEFTYDPTEEPPPQKKKRKRVVQKKNEKTKPVFIMNYDRNVTKSMVNLKKILSTKSQIKTQTVHSARNVQVLSKQKPVIKNVNNVIEKNHTTEKNVLQQNFNSFHVEDIVLNNETNPNDHDDLNYSPVNSPIQIRQPSEPRNDYNREVEAKNNDPLNLQGDLSFFDDQPAASSSVNVSVRNPSATPWRAEFEQLPIKWQVNTYVKPNMTPAFESSFIDFNNKKKHVYTNIVPEHAAACTDAVLPEIVENEAASKLKQTSIISFFKEVVERNEKKKCKLKSTPIKENSIFEDISHISHVSPMKENVKSTINKNVTPNKYIPSNDIVTSPDNVGPAQKKSPLMSKQNANHKGKNNDENVTFFGFDESEQDQENMSPIKEINKQCKKALRPRARAILQEFNMQTGPTRAAVKLRANNKAVSPDTNKIVREQSDDQNTEKVIDNPPRDIDTDIIITNTDDGSLNADDSQSVHLFEDLELIHHLKPSRKSYGKTKKVTFRHNSESCDNDDDAASDHNGSSLEEDNLADLTFHMPSLQQKKSRKKKTTAKKQLSKKEKKEADAWAAGFNSMCEDVDQYDLIVE